MRFPAGAENGQAHSVRVPLRCPRPRRSACPAWCTSRSRSTTSSGRRRSTPPRSAGPIEDYSQFTGSPYWGIVTGPEDQPGINGGLLQRPAPAPAGAQGTNAFVCTMGVGDYDETERRILDAGGQVALPKMALPGMAWQGYYLDTEGNTFGIHQPDPAAA